MDILKEVIAAILVASGIMALYLWYSRTERLRSSDLGGSGIVLRSERFGLSGKPDVLLRRGHSYIPVEYKSYRSGGRPGDWDVAQLLAYCLLIEDATGHASGGRIVYTDGTFQIDWNRQSRDYIIGIINEMRSGRNAMTADRWKCKRCEFSSYCGR